MADPAVSNAASLGTEAIFAKGDIVYQGLSWYATPMVAQLAYPLGATVLKFWDMRPGETTAKPRVGEQVLIGGNTYEVTAYTAPSGGSLAIVEIASPGLIIAMDWTMPSRLMQSPEKSPAFRLISASGTTVQLKIPPLWAYSFMQGCKFTYSGQTVTASNGNTGIAGDSSFISTGNVVVDKVTITTTATAHAGVVDELVTVPEELPAGAGNGQHRRGRTSAYYTEQDTTSGGVTRRTRTASFLGTLDLRPYLVPFPHAADALGYAYTEPDLVGCWIGGELYGIPTVLPTSYLPLRGLGEPAHMVNPYTSWAVAAHYGSASSQLANWGRPRINATIGSMQPQHILMPTGYLECDWFPREHAMSVQSRSVGVTLFGEKSVGWRKCQLTVGNLDPAAAAHYVIGYVDYVTHLNEVVVLTGALVANSVMDLGALLPPLGQVKSFFFQVSLLNGAGVRVRSTTASFYTAKLTPRVDVPMPWDCFGDETYRAGTANLFARGGYHPGGVVPIPRTPLVSSTSPIRSDDLRLLTPGGSQAADSNGATTYGALMFRLRANVGTYTLSKTGTASTFSEYSHWMQSTTLLASGTSVSIELSPDHDRFVRVGITAATDVVSLA